MNVVVEFSELYEPLFKTNARYIHLWGGRGRGGSFTATNYFLFLLTQPKYFRGYFMREIFSDIRESLWRDFKDRVEENDTVNENDFDFNESQMCVTYRPTGNMIMSKGFKKSSGNRTAKLKSIAGATHVLIEEADEIAGTDFKQLDDSLRTIKADIQVLQIFNPPPKGHWFWKRWYNLIPLPKKNPNDPNETEYSKAEPKDSPSLLSIHSTYLDNIKNLNESFIENLLNYKSTDPDYHAIMVEGLVSEGAKGRIYRNWIRCDTMPGAYEKFYGLDWGFNDPVAVIEVEVHNKTVWCREMIYERGMTNRELSDRLKSLGISKSAKIYADCAEPKDIKDLKGYGWNVFESEKGTGSVVNGIKYLKDFTVNAETNSINLWHENENYKWALDQNKNPTNEPKDEYNHLMDALRYAVVTKLRKPKGIRVI
jgi:phage terminase large subunit